jgi:DNA topoisomerase-1
VIKQMQKSATAGTAQAAIHSAAAAGLNYVVTDRSQGIRRLCRGAHFAYVGPNGDKVDDAETLARIRSLVIPPAWRDVWISADPCGHLQATGRDARGRKQYRYHPQWRAVRDENKFDRLASFARALPRIRRRVNKDLALPGLPRDKVLAAVVRLLETTFIRVGNERYARENGSYGLTTLRNRHVRVAGERIEFHFSGKSRKAHAIALTDAQLARLIRRCRELPGYELFQYLENGAARPVDAGEVNAYLRELTGQDYTAKDFRTWGGTLPAGLALACEPPSSRTAAAKAVTQAIATVARQLGNTPAICRKCYVHPRIIHSFQDGSLAATAEEARRRRRSSYERLILALLEARPARQRKQSQSVPAIRRHARSATSVGPAVVASV